MKKYVVLTQADKRKKLKDYTIFIEEQNDSKTLNSGFALSAPSFSFIFRLS